MTSLRPAFLWKLFSDFAYLWSPSAALRACLLRKVCRSFSLVCLDSLLISSFLCLLRACKKRLVKEWNVLEYHGLAWASSVHTRVCFFSSGASPSNTNIGLMRKKRSLQIRWKRVSKWAFCTPLPSRSLTPFTAWLSHMLISGSIWLRLMQGRRPGYGRDGGKICDVAGSGPPQWQVVEINHGAVCAQHQDWNIYKLRPLSNKDTNSKYLSFESLGVDGFPRTL